MPEPVNNPYLRLEVDLSAIAANLAALRRRLPAGGRVAAVVKADAYGHGLVPVARRLLAEGVEALAVATWPEGRVLRAAGIAAPVLVMLGCQPHEAAEVVSLDLTPVVARPACLQALAAAAAGQGKTARCQLKVDTGMGRLGLAPAEVPGLLRQAAALPSLEITGLVSHLAEGGDPASRHAGRQGARLAGLLAELRDQGHRLADSSLCGTGGLLVPPWPGEPAAGLHRLGIGLYGGRPHDNAPAEAGLITAMRLTSRLIQVRPLAAGGGVSYGRTWIAPRDTLLGAVPVGYSDGYPRAASNRGVMLVAGRPAPIRGRVCMNLTMIDLGHLDPPPRAGEPVVLLGSQGSQAIDLDQLAGWGGTIGYDLACSLGRANPRHYL